MARGERKDASKNTSFGQRGKKDRGKEESMFRGESPEKGLQASKRSRFLPMVRYKLYICCSVLKCTVLRTGKFTCRNPSHWMGIAFVFIVCKSCKTLGGKHPHFSIPD